MIAARTAAAAVLALVACSPAAAETSKTIDVTARIVPGCLVATDASGRWGVIDLGTVAGVSGTSVQATLISTAAAGITIDCTPGLTASLAADGGDHPIASGRSLQRAGLAGSIPYQLHADGSATAWTVPLPLNFVASRRIVPIRAVATLTGPAAAGAYTDTVRVTLSW